MQSHRLRRGDQRVPDHARDPARITCHESGRLLNLFSNLATVENAVAKIGPATDTEPSKDVSYRVITYTGLSETVDVRLTDFGPNHGLRCELQGKYLGKPKS